MRVIQFDDGGAIVALTHGELQAINVALDGRSDGWDSINHRKALGEEVDQLLYKIEAEQEDCAAYYYCDEYDDGYEFF